MRKKNKPGRRPKPMIDTSPRGPGRPGPGKRRPAPSKKRRPARARRMR